MSTRQLLCNPLTLGVCIIVVGYIFLSRWYFISRVSPVQLVMAPMEQKLQSCPNVLNNMLKGKWKPRRMTKSQKNDMQTFLELIRKGWGLPKTLQREDLLCGNASYAPKPEDRFRIFRALCDPLGKTPCCMNNKCTAQPINKCKCENCLDIRSKHYAEYSDWITNDKQCHVHDFEDNEACKILDGMTIFLSGDSLMRHTYLAFQLLLNNDLISGSLKNGTKKDVAEKCKGVYAYSERVCSNYMSRETSNICNGRVNLTFGEYYSTRFSSDFINATKDLTKKQKSLIIAGIGHHDSFNYRTIKNKFIGPAIHVIKKNRWPRLVWTMPSTIGLLRDTRSKVRPKRKAFYQKMIPYFDSLNIPVFDPEPLTKDIFSMDGIHHGLGVNVKIVQILINYIEELRNKEKW